MKVLLPLFLLLLFPVTTFARVTPGDIYQEKRQAFEQSLSKISDPKQKEAIREIDGLLYQTNQSVCDRFEKDILKMSAILQELRRRLDVEGKPTVVAFGAGRNEIEDAEYWVNWAAEAVAYQRIQDYTPRISTESSVGPAIKVSTTNLRSNLNGLAAKIIKAKGEVGQALKVQSVVIPGGVPKDLPGS